MQGFILSLAHLALLMHRCSSTNGTWNGFRAMLSSGRRATSRVPPHRRILIMKLLGCFALIASIPAWAQVSPIMNDLPSREFGHAKLTNPVTTGSANLVEGRELSAPLSIAF